MKKRALYPGSFDPLTFGHLDLIKRGLSMFDEVTVAVVRNSDKDPLFSIDERMALIRASTRGLKVKVESFDGLLVDHVKNTGYPVVLRGLRALTDFEYEFQMALMNRKLRSAYEVVFLMPDERYVYVSSSVVKEVARLGGEISGFVPQQVEKAIRAKLKRR